MWDFSNALKSKWTNWDTSIIYWDTSITITVADSKEGRFLGVTNHHLPVKMIEKTVLFLPVETFFLVTICLCRNIWCALEYLVTCEGHYIISYPKDGVCYRGGCIQYFVSSNKNLCLSKKVWAFWRPFHYIIQLYSQHALALSVTMGLHSY